MATVYAVASAKGGVGKTTTAAAVATVLAGTGADVVAVDADIGMANLASSLGIDVGETTLHDVLADRADPLDAVHEGPNGLRVVPGTTDLDAYAAADPTALRQVIDALDAADYLVLDVGAGLSHESSLPLGLADETLLVSTPERDALGDTEKTRQLTERLGGTVAGAAITRTDPSCMDAEDELVAELLRTTVLCRIPEDPAIGEAIDAGKPLVTFAPAAPASHAYRELTRELTDIAVEEPAVGESAVEVDEPAETSEADASAAGADDDDADDDGIIVADAEATGMEPPEDELEGIVADEPETDAVEEAETDAVEEADAVEDSVADEIDDPETDDVDEPTEDDPDDELAGSVPFRDDDTGMDTALAREREDSEEEEEKKGGFFSRLFGR
ncbi:P-loop NTPase [Halorubrum vacuolatum]|uniref:Septum site-determining protein MinD n=1 Tax=Halorubrum vacuolatum TaxID=63740 RepID=A0A238VPA3_HALVU|nr:P-loop NTPase [Halorubrum vacuolatum]SNR36048.1 septum site-determining protein MinD [Halorubrum vacuolatum]